MDNETSLDRGRVPNLQGDDQLSVNLVVFHAVLEEQTQHVV